jgi:release factor glutamine methyltransferase
MSKRKLQVWELNFLRCNNINPESLNLNNNLPIEYLIGKCQFYHLILNIKPPILIPRIETEELIDLSFQLVKNYQKMIKVAEVGTGSLAISLALAHTLQQANKCYQITASDISCQALELAKENLQLLKLKNIFLIYSDLLSNYPHKKFDLILANLPYIPTARLANLSKSVIDHETVGALNGGKDGLFLIVKLMHQIKNYLTKDGHFILEIDSSHQLKKFEQFKQIYKLKIVKDCFKRHRFLIGQFKI